MKNNKTLRICTWNLGQYVWMGLLGRFFPIHGHKNKIQNYNRGNAPVIKKILEKIKPDIFIGQELDRKTHIGDFWEQEKSEVFFSPSYYDGFLKLYLGQERLRNTPSISQHKELTIIELDHFVIFSVHLNAFSAYKRLEKVTYICKESQKHEKPIICLGDFNIWKRDSLFLFQNDKKAYDMMIKHFDHPTKNIRSTTTTGFSLDNIFTQNIKYIDVGIQKENAMYMDHYPVWIDIEY